MEHQDDTNDVVHPEVRAHINSLVSALGGISADDDGRYRLGDDALEVLRDLKKWIRFYDEKTNRMDVARCIAEANLLDGDLLHILSTWPEDMTDNKFRARIALACFEIMVPLTWPMDRDPEKMTVNHHRHMPVLELSQVAYKRSIINFDGARILHAAVRAALPSMAVPIGDRTPRDQGVIKLVLFFLRNIAMIEPPANVAYDGDETQISRSATIDAFSYQDIFMLLLTLCSNMGEDFRTEDVTVMDIIYHLVKRVDVNKLFMNEEQVNKTRAKELSSMMSKEYAMLKAYNRKGPTRHNRFGTMLWMQRDDGKMSSISGQDALADASARQKKMDDSKTFRPPRKAKRKDVEYEAKDLGREPKLDARAKTQLRGFVEEFLDAGFNPLFEHVRKSIDREAPHVQSYHRRQFMYLVAWFLEAERVRRSSKRSSQPNGLSEDVNSFNLVAGVLNQTMFITLNRTMVQAWEHKDWPELNASMRCFTQILLTVQEMSQSPNEDDQEIAENTLSRLFYEDATHDLVANVVRQYKGQGFDYLDAATELTHHFLRILESYSKQNVDMQVRSRRRTRRKKKAAQAAAGEEVAVNGADDGDESADDQQNAEQTSKERKFDFTRFSLRFTPQGVVDSFVEFTKFYRDLSDSQLKRAHRYFYRVAFKHEMSVMLFRVDIIHLLHGMIKGPTALEKSSSMYKEWEELSKQILRKCFKKIEERPALLIEMLFSKIPSTAHFLEYGFEKQTMSTTTPRPAAELEFKYTEDREQQISIAVGVLLDKNQADHINWVKKVLSDAESERRALQEAERVIASVETEGPDGEQPAAPELGTATFLPFTAKADSESRQTAMFKNGHLRLLMKLCGIEKLAPTLEETPTTLWAIPPTVAPDDIKEILDIINKAEFNPPTFEDGISAEDQLRRKSAARKKTQKDKDEDESEDDERGLDELFPAGGPTARKAADEKPKKKGKLKRRRRAENPEEGENDSERDEKARRRRDRELEKARKIKSQLYITASDDESDTERDRDFFAREEEQRKKMEKVTANADVVATSVAEAEKAKSKPKRKQPALVSDDEGDDDLVPGALGSTQRRGTGQDDDDEITEDSDSDGSADTSASSKRGGGSSQGSARKRRKTTNMSDPESDNDAEDEVIAPVTSKEDTAGEKPSSGGGDAMDVDEDDEDDLPAARSRPRQRTKGGFVEDSSDDE